MTTDLLNTVQHAEAVRKKMVKKSQSNQAGSISDVEKIYIQLYLDVDAFGAQLIRFGIRRDDFKPYQQLLEAVSMGKKVSDTDTKDE